MSRRPPRSTRTDTLFPYTTLFRSLFLPGAADRVFGKDWDIFYGGYTASDPHDLLNSDVQGAHMMGFSAVGAHLGSQYLEQLTCEGVHPPIDAAYVWFRRSHPGLPTAFADPPLPDQRPSRSDIAALARSDRDPLVRLAATPPRACPP